MIPTPTAEVKPSLPRHPLKLCKPQLFSSIACRSVRIPSPSIPLPLDRRICRLRAASVAFPLPFITPAPRLFIPGNTRRLYHHDTPVCFRPSTLDRRANKSGRWYSTLHNWQRHCHPFDNLTGYILQPPFQCDYRLFTAPTKLDTVV